MRSSRWLGWIVALLPLALACGEPTGEAPTIDPLAAAGPEAERAMVRAVLDDIADAHRPEDVSDEALEQLWESRMAGRPLPARIPLERLEGELRAELADRARLAALVELVAELERSVGVERDLAAIDTLATLPIRFEGP